MSHHSESPMHQRRNNGTATTSNMYSNNHRGYDIEGGASASSSHRGRAAGGGRSANPHGGDTNANILEQQNNERISMLSDQVARLKGLTIDIGNEVREQNSLLDNMGDGFQSTRDMLTGSLRRISTMLESGGMKHMCYMVGFCVLVMIFLWWLMSYKGTSGA